MSSLRDDGRLLLHAVCLSAILVAEWTPPSAAADPPSTEAIPTNSAASVPLPDSLLLLTSGRIVTGQISQTAGGYVVELPTGSMLVPFSHVRLEADNLHDAYRKLRRSMPQRTASNHFALARWCLSHELKDEARHELLSALELEPQRASIRSTLRRLQSAPENGGSTADSGLVPLPDVDEEPLPEAESLAGLSPQSAQKFVAKIQPLLVNKCGQGSCHGATGKGDFQLSHVRVGGRHHRVTTERNLAAALKLINLSAPESSRLLSVPIENHGGSGQTVFFGRGGAAQLEMLREWVAEVAAERGGATGARIAADTSAPAAKSISELNIRELVFAAPGTHPSAASAAAAATPPSPETAPQTNSPAIPKSRVDTTDDPPAAVSRDDDLLRELLNDGPTDKFDPDVFNLRMHGRKALEKRRISAPDPESDSPPVTRDE